MRLFAVVLAVGVVAATSAGSLGADATGPPLVGGAYYGVACSGSSVDVLKDAVDPTLEREQIFAMHASGLTSLALVLNYSTDPSRANAPYSGAVTVQPDGTVSEPYRSRFIQYLKGARDAGFTDLTIRFEPQGPN